MKVFQALTVLQAALEGQVNVEPQAELESKGCLQIRVSLVNKAPMVSRETQGLLVLEANLALQENKVTLV